MPEGSVKMYGLHKQGRRKEAPGRNPSRRLSEKHCRKNSFGSTCIDDCLRYRDGSHRGVKDCQCDNGKRL